MIFMYICSTICFVNRYMSKSNTVPCTCCSESKYLVFQHVASVNKYVVREEEILVWHQYGSHVVRVEVIVVSWYIYVCGINWQACS